MSNFISILWLFAQKYNLSYFTQKYKNYVNRIVKEDKRGDTGKRYDDQKVCLFIHLVLTLVLFLVFFSIIFCRIKIKRISTR